MTKMSYVENADRKKFIRDMIIPKGERIIGLGGPNITEYIAFVRERGYRDIEIYENNQEIIMRQIPQLMGQNIKLIMKDIIAAKHEEGIFLDADYCCHISSIRRHVQKLQGDYALTVSELMKKKFSSIEPFLRYRGEVLISIESPNDNERVITSDKQKYVAYSYCDTSPMLVIKPFNQKTHDKKENELLQ